MTAPASGVVIAQTSSHSYESSGGENGSGSHSYSHTYCTVSGYGIISTRDNYGYAIVNKGTTITLVYDGNGWGSVGHATFYPFK